jgi:prevent-host-death family protein
MGGQSATAASEEESANDVSVSGRGGWSASGGIDDAIAGNAQRVLDCASCRPRCLHSPSATPCSTLARVADLLHYRVVPDLPQRELRNNVSAVLRAAEAGETYTVTVDGRPVAQLGPYRPRQWLSAEQVRSLLATPTDPGLVDSVAEHDVDPGLTHDPWTPA